MKIVTKSKYKNNEKGQMRTLTISEQRERLKTKEEREDPWHDFQCKRHHLMHNCSNINDSLKQFVQPRVGTFLEEEKYGKTDRPYNINCRQWHEFRGSKKVHN